MAERLKKTVLLVEDEVLLALAEKVSLEKYGYVITTVNTGEKAVEAVAKNPRDIDLILMDINLGRGMDGTEAAALILKNHDLPVVFLSSHTDPAVVEKTEKITSYGYVVKSSSITVLDASIKMAFRLHDAHRELKAQKRKLDSALVQYEQTAEELERYFSSSLDMLCIAETDGTFVRLNPEWEKVLGYRVSELEGRSFLDLVHPEDRENTLAALARLDAQEEVLSFENRYRCRDGSYRWIEWRSKPMGSTIYAAARDVTERKQMEDDLKENEAKYASLFTSMKEGFALHEIICDDKGKPVDYRFLDLNPAFEALTGMKKADILGKTVLSVLPDTEPFWIERYGKVALTGESISFQSYSSSLDRHYQVTAFCPREGRFAVTFSDITETKKTEKELQTKEEAIRITLQSIGDGVISTDGYGNIVNMNPVAEKLCGWKQEEALGKPLTQVFRIINGETREPADNPIKKVMKTGKIFGLINNTVLVSREGGEFRIADSVAPILNDTGDRTGVVLVFRDVTEQYRKDLQLVERVKELNGFYGISEIIEKPGISLDAILQKTAALIPKSYSYPEQAACRITLEGNECSSDGFKAGTRFQRSTLRVGGRNAGSLEVHYPDSPLPGETDPFFKEEQQFLNAVAERLGRVIERMRNEERLRENEARLKFALANAGDGLWDWNVETNRVYFSPKWKEIMGYGEDEIGDSFDEWESWVHPDDLEQCHKDLEDHFNGLTSAYSNIHRERCKDGEYKWFLDRGKVVERTKDGKPLRVIGTHVDITERKQIEEALFNQRQYLQTILDTTADGFWIVNSEKKLAHANRAYSAMTGYSVEELERMSVSDIDCLEDPETTRKRIERIKEKGQEIFETKHRRKDGGIIEVEVSTSYLDVNGGEFICFSRDISGRKRAKEQTQRQLEEKEILLKEVHHRIKNNIASIGSLLSIQADESSNEAVKAALKDACSRVQSMQVLYEKLLPGEDYQEVEVKDYIDGLLSSLSAVFPESGKITLERHIADITLSSGKIIPLGIIINELLTNVFKYAFPEGTGGHVSVTLQATSGRGTLVIQDNGVGLPEDAASGGSEGFGLMLVRMLSQELNGSFTIETSQGTRSVLEFEF